MEKSITSTRGGKISRISINSSVININSAIIIIVKIRIKIEV